MKTIFFFNLWKYKAGIKQCFTEHVFNYNLVVIAVIRMKINEKMVKAK